MNSHESKIQQQFVKCVESMFQLRFPWLCLLLEEKVKGVKQVVKKSPLYMNDNSGKMNVRATSRRRAEGRKSGVPDVTLPVPNGDYHGLYIEFKLENTSMHGKTYQSKNQKEWCRYLNYVGYLCVVCRSAGEAIDVVEKYMDDYLENRGRH